MDSKADSSIEMSIEIVRKIDALCDEFEIALNHGKQPQIVDYLKGFEAAGKERLFEELLSLELGHCFLNDKSIDVSAYRTQFPEYQSIISEQLEKQTFSDQKTQQEALGAIDEPNESVPEKIGRYRVEKQIGAGGFGKVYLAFDESLQRKVAIKLPDSRRLRTSTLEMFMNEARTLATLDHPHIVPIHDVGKIDDATCFIVSRFIDGENLSELISVEQLPRSLTVEIVIAMADALHYAHRKKLIHRDIKPANILVDQDGQPFLTDFGLALTHDDFGKSGAQAGTPAYMSPEQARGEGHLVDGRSDIFSLGIVFYELLTGERPFTGRDWREIAEQIISLSVRPPRQLNDDIPRELERICLKSLAKDAGERYTTAQDLADDLREFQSLASEAFRSETESAYERRQIGSRKVVPKGLRAFGEEDSDFFLSLLPGPRDRNGLPDSIRFWKNQVESTDPLTTFRIGLIYGPSGCGKSSFAKAGLLPRLAGFVEPILIEATPDRLTQHLMTKLGSDQLDMPVDEPLANVFRKTREDHSERRTKTLVVIDQFEQWLFATPESCQTDFINALRQCDGVNLQVLLLVRDDFWTSVNRLMKKTGSDIVEGKNSSMMDLFDISHARSVLKIFGQAHGALPCDVHISEFQKQFIESAIDELADQERVICVRLALFAEMVKHREWNPETLEQLGGFQGIGVRFLNEMFDSSTAPHDQRLHAEAAQEVLRRLLPTSGSSDLKKASVPQVDLQHVSGYHGRDSDFRDLINILDQRLRLITPVNPSETDTSFNLTHDYLVPSIRQWLNQKLMETRRGRAQKLLVEYTESWNARRESRLLPSSFVFLQIHFFVPKVEWTAPQNRLMRQARKKITRRFSMLGLTCLFIAIVGCWSWWTGTKKQAELAANAILNADLDRIDLLISELPVSKRHVDPHFRQALIHDDDETKLRALIALRNASPAIEKQLVTHSLSLPSNEFYLVLPRIDGSQIDQKALWDILDDTDSTNEQRFRAASLLAKSVENGNIPNKWKEHARYLAAVQLQFVAQNPLDVEFFLDALRPVGDVLDPHLRDIQIATESDERLADWATTVRTAYAGSKPSRLIDILELASQGQFQIATRAIAKNPKALELLRKTAVELSIPPNDDKLIESDSIRRISNLLIAADRFALLDLWQIMKESCHLDLETHLIHSYPTLCDSIDRLANSIPGEKDPIVLQRLIHCLGEFTSSAHTKFADLPVAADITGIYATTADAGLRSSIEWLSHRWNLKLPTVDFKRIPVHANWRTTPQGHTLVRLGPAEFVSGSSPSNTEVLIHERRQKVTIPRQFEISTKPVTVEEIERFVTSRGLNFKRPNIAYSGPYGISWYAAAHYCNWLSEQAGLPESEWCYVRNSNDDFANGMQVVEQFLEKSGFRLPTEAEWEFACRGTTSTSRYCGNHTRWLHKYAWHQNRFTPERTHPVGMLKPNRYGLFDMLGNTWEWCHDAFDQKQQTRTADRVDRPESGQVLDADDRILRGGSFVSPPQHVRAAIRNHEQPFRANVVRGFRIARTVTDATKE